MQLRDWAEAAESAGIESGSGTKFSWLTAEED